MGPKLTFFDLTKCFRLFGVNKPLQNQKEKADKSYLNIWHFSTAGMGNSGPYQLSLLNPDYLDKVIPVYQKMGDTTLDEVEWGKISSVEKLTIPI